MQTHPPPDLSEFEILRQAGALVAVRKPAGILVHNSEWAGPPETCLRDLVSQALGREAWPAHRLDRQTSGIVLFTADKERLGDLMACIRADGSEKTYLAIVRGIVTGPLVMDSPLTNKGGNEVPALTRAFVVGTDAKTRSSLLRVVPETGRIHQIRRHLRRMNHPIVNDADHGDTRFSRAFRAATGFSRLGLHALSLRIVFDDVTHTITAPLPHDLTALIAHTYGASALELFPERALLDDEGIESTAGRAPVL
jgi:tRNA pseudouridine65 synthase